MTEKNPEIKARIKNGQCYGSGDNLMSLLVNKKRLHKNSPAHRIYNTLEHTKNHISSVLLLEESKDLEPFDLYTLTWLRDNLHSLGSHCFLWGNTKNHTFPDNLLLALEDRLQYFQSFLDSCPDFTIQQHSYFIYLDTVRVWIRAMEVAYVDWHRTLFGEIPPTDERKYTASLLNRLSTYVFNLERYYAYLWDIKEVHWEGGMRGKVLEFTPPIYGEPPSLEVSIVSNLRLVERPAINKVAPSPDDPRDTRMD